MKKHFGSDNYAGACPEVWHALQELGGDHHTAYGDDEFTARARDEIRKTFEHDDCEVFFVFNGTAANSLALASICRSFDSVICTPTAHIQTDECGAPEFFSGGAKLVLTSNADGKVTPRQIERLRNERHGDLHFSKARVVSVTQATELGTVYSPSELKAVCDAAHAMSLAVHMDGARFANAVASLDVKPKEISWQAGIDVLCLGGTKNGMPFGEAVVFFEPELAADFEYRRKQAGQLASKMRFLAIPWLAMLENDRWVHYARIANERAAFLERRIREIPGVTFPYTRQANSVFIDMPPGVAQRLSEHWKFYSFTGVNGARFVCAWDTTEDDVRALADDLRSLVCQP